MRCEVQTAGTIDLYFYGELPHCGARAEQATCLLRRMPPGTRGSVGDSRRARGGRCGHPPGGDWSGFMVRLNTSSPEGREERGPHAGGVRDAARPRAVSGRGGGARAGHVACALPNNS